MSSFEIHRIRRGSHQRIDPEAAWEPCETASYPSQARAMVEALQDLHGPYIYRIVELRSPDLELPRSRPRTPR